MRDKCQGIRHWKVCAQDGKFAGWPANSGLWAWGNELLVGFALADHQVKEGHTYRRETARQKFARSLDGGETWSRLDALLRNAAASWPAELSLLPRAPLTSPA